MAANGRFNRYVAPFQEVDENFDLDPPKSYADNYIFMPVLVSSAMNKFFQDEKQFVRSFTTVENGKLKGNKKKMINQTWNETPNPTVIGTAATTSTLTTTTTTTTATTTTKNKSINSRSRSHIKINVKQFVGNVIMSPDNYGLPYEAVSFNSKDGTLLRGFLIAGEMEADRLGIPTIIFFHGNAGNIGDNLPCVCAIFEDINCNIFVFDYRGYGFSEGKPSERGAYWDAQAAFEYVYSRQDLDSSQIVLLGQSLGGAIVIDLAIRSNFSHRIAGIIIENTFSSIHALLLDYTSYWLLKPLRPLFRLFNLKRKFPTIAKMCYVQCPTLFIVGMKDQVIPPSHSARLYSKCISPQKRIYVSEDGEHLNCFLTDPNYTPEIQKFLQDFVVTFSLNSPHNTDTFRLRRSRSTNNDTNNNNSSHGNGRGHSHSHSRNRNRNRNNRNQDHNNSTSGYGFYQCEHKCGCNKTNFAA